MRQFRIPLAVVLGLLVSSPAFATFHLMQIEQVIGGVNGETTAQAIQLRQRANFQNLVGSARLVVRDATGANPIVLIDMAGPVPSGLAGRRILIASPNFQTSPAVTPDFVMTNLIPASYLAAGSLTFEQDSPTIVYWRLSWGGAGYTGTGTGAVDNDANGQFNPAFAGPLPSATEQALQFRFAASALSITNANDYLLTTGPATFTNNANVSGLVVQPVPVEPFTWGRIKDDYR